MGRATATEEHVVQRTTVDLDMTELDAAKSVLGTSTIRDTVNGALRDVARRAALRNPAAMIEQGAFEVVDPEELAELRRPRIED